jgi:rhodanese-related sulfurtransferase
MITKEKWEKLYNENKNNPNWIILDVRTKKEFDIYKIENSINIDFYLKDFEKRLSKLDKNKKLISFLFL